MSRLQSNAAPVPRTALLYGAVAFTLIAVFIADLLTPLGVAVWVFYLAPLALCLFAWQPHAPLAVAAFGTLLTVAGFFLSSPGMNPGIAQVNRGLGLVTMWGVAAVARAFIEARRAMRRTTWLQQAEVRLAQGTAGERTLDELGRSALEAIVAPLDAVAGALYAVDGDGLRRVAAWALDGGADGANGSQESPAQVRLGEGVLGQAAAERRALVLRDLPAGSLRVRSALADAAPAHVLVAPLMADGYLTGMVEVALLGRAAPLDDALALLAAIGDTVGIALRSAAYRTRLQELLAQTQRQSDVLSAQQEELRASNEELEAQGHALRESQAHLEMQQSELEQTNVRLEEQTQRLEQQKRELLDAQAEQARHAAALEQASRYKSEFLANMSHELRTPLNSSLILAKLLADNRDGNLTDEQVRYAQTIRSSNNDLLALINDILDLSKIEAGRIDIDPEPVALARLIEPLRDAFEPVARERGLAFAIEVDAAAPHALVTDAQRLSQILKNLLSNAFKFTESGGVTLRVGPAEPDGVAFAVRDTGIGIDSGQHETVFEAFRQADGSTSRRFGGTGLGLSISRELARLLGGRIALDSAPGAGSMFTLFVAVDARATVDAAPAPPQVGGTGQAGGTAPAPAAAQAAPDRAGASRPAARATGAAEPSGSTGTDGGAPGAASALPAPIADDREQLARAGRLVLVVEDDPAFARILYELAHEMDFDCVHAPTVAEALALARRLRPSGVLLDMELPDGSGLSLLEQLKRDPATRHIPVHVVSVDDHAQTALALGAIGYALKPADRDRLAEAIGRLESRLKQTLRRVLVVEDDAALRDNIALLLGGRDVQITGAGTVAEALEHLAHGTFDCMVMDLALPDGSGYDLLEQMAAGQGYAFPPVIVYTGRALTREEEQRLRRYSKSIIVKGARSPERLLDEVTLFLHQVESDLPPEHQRMLRQARQRDAVFEGRRILLAEDDARNIFALSRVLEPLGAAMEIARNGREALDALARRDDIDLVLMDVMMPEMDGLAATAEIRRQPRWAKLPIIALTAKAMPEDRRKCLQAGANDYVSKPIDVDRLVSLCRVWMPR